MIKKIVVLLMFLIINSYCITVDEILDNIEKNEKPKTSKSVMIQKIWRPNGSVSESELIAYSADEGKKSLMEYTKPARIKGMKILSLNDGEEIWVYFPRTGRTRKIASSQRKNSVNGSDFSYEDLSTKDRRKDYTHTLVGSEKYNLKDCYKIKGVAKSKDAVYSQYIMLVDKEIFVPYKVVYYDDTKEEWKVMLMENVKKVSSYYTPEKIIMKNLLRGSKTEMIFKSIEYDIPVKEELFTQRYLSK